MIEVKGWNDTVDGNVSSYMCITIVCKICDHFLEPHIIIRSSCASDGDLTLIWIILLQI